MITLGRFDIHYAVNTLSRFSMAPRQTHLQAMIRVFGYLKKYPQGQLTVDPTTPNRVQLPKLITPHAWQEFYPDAIEEIPSDAPAALGVSPTTMAYVDADHAHDQITRRSVTGVLLLVNGMPIRWYSKRQQTVETSSYGSELVAARIATDHIIELRYKLRMLGVPITAPTVMLGDNRSVLLNTTVPSSMLKKKHNAIAYHRVRESIAAGIIRFFHIPSTENLADILTKPLNNHLFHQITEAILFTPSSSPTPQDPNISFLTPTTTNTDMQSSTKLPDYISMADLANPSDPSCRPPTSHIVLADVVAPVTFTLPVAPR
jgi:hypothetical protein